MFSTMSTLNSIAKYTQQSSAYVPPQSVVLLLRYDFTNSGTTILDKSGNNRNATMNGTNLLANLSSYPNTNLAKQNTKIYSLTSQSTNSSNFIALNSSFTMASPDFSYSFWLYPFATATDGDCKIWESVNEAIMMWRGKNASPYNGVTYNFNNLTLFNMTQNAWHHVVMTCTYSTLKMNIYVDNVLVLSNVSLASSNFYASNTVSAIKIGRSLSSGHYSFIGNFADFRMYNTVLNASYVDALYNGYL